MILNDNYFSNFYIYLVLYIFQFLNIYLLDAVERYLKKHKQIYVIIIYILFLCSICICSLALNYLVFFYY